MKKYRYLLIYLATAAIVSCGSGATETGNKPGSPFQASAAVNKSTPAPAASLEYCSEFRIDSLDNNSPSMKVNISLPVVNDSRNAAAINQEIQYAAIESGEGTPQENINEYISLLKGNYYSNYSTYVDCKNMGETTHWLNFNYEIKGEVVESKDGVIAVKIVKTTYEGGPHGYESTTYLNFDKTSGKLLALEDIFSEGFDEQLLEIMTAALVKEKGAKDIDELRNKGYLYDADFYATSNFVLGKDSITFHYNRYEIAPYALGETIITIGYNELELMK